MLNCMLTVFNIQRYSIHDGDGVRTNIFFKGCPLRCLWCNNPEGLETSPSIMFDERLCHRFGDCLKAESGQILLEKNRLVINRDLISDSAIYRDICPSKALIVAGEEMSVTEILAEIEKDIPFYMTSKGGVTLTGGEPFSQGSELKELIIELSRLGINITAETSLHLPWEVIEDYVNIVDTFLADLKHMDDEKFTKYAGGNAKLVLNNFRKLDDTGRKFIVRVPVIPGFNSSDPELSAIIDFVSSLKNATELNFIPFHSLAKEKYAMLGLDYKYADTCRIKKEEILPFIKYAENRGITAKIMN